MKETLQPPIGLKPKKIHDQQRATEILEAMGRYVNNEKAIPKEWFIELQCLYEEA